MGCLNFQRKSSDFLNLHVTVANAICFGWTCTYLSLYRKSLCMCVCVCVVPVKGIQNRTETALFLFFFLCAAPLLSKGSSCSKEKKGVSRENHCPCSFLSILFDARHLPSQTLFYSIFVFIQRK